MSFRKNHFREVLVLSLPIVVGSIITIFAALISFYNAEIANFHGYPTRSLRVGGLKQMLKFEIASLNPNIKSRYLPNKSTDSSDIKQINLRVRKAVLNKLKEDMPASAKIWQPAWLIRDGTYKKVQLKNRGQRLTNYFWPRKAWQIKIKKKDIPNNGLRLIKISPFIDRIENYVALSLGKKLGLPVSRTELVQLFINKKEQGLYLQEEEIDESMIRHNSLMPGDVFHGELFFPNEPKLNTDDLFVNPFYWRKKSRNNLYDEEYRPYLTEFLDLICDESYGSYEKLYSLLDVNEYARYFSVITFMGDQHVDDSHNHKFYFNPLNGKFEGILWNIMFGDLNGVGVESFNNRLFRKLVRDPRFLDQVHTVLYNEILARGVIENVIAELDSIKDNFLKYDVETEQLSDFIENTKLRLKKREDVFKKVGNMAEVIFDTQRVDYGIILSINATSIRSLKLVGISLNHMPNGIHLYEDRDFNGKISEMDRELKLSLNNNTINILQNDALLFVGRDLSAPFMKHREEDFRVSNNYTKLAPLQSRLLLEYEKSRDPVTITSLNVVQTIGQAPVDVKPGKPKSKTMTASIHPWRLQPEVEPVNYIFEGTVTLKKDLLMRSNDTLTIAPGTRFLLGPKISIICHNRIHLDNVTFKRLIPDKPWGVLALQGAAASGSSIKSSTFSGGSNKTYDYIYYSGMLSVYYADSVLVDNCLFSDNILGDDTIRFAECNGISITRTNVNRANGDAIDLDICTGKLQEITIQDSGNDGIDLMTTKVSLHEIRIKNAGDKGISLGEESNPIITKSVIMNSPTGIGIKDGSNPIISNVEFRDNKIAIDSYDKNWRYPGGGRGEIYTSLFHNNQIDIRLDKKSQISLTDCLTENKFDLPANLKVGQFVIKHSELNDSDY